MALAIRKQEDGFPERVKQIAARVGGSAELARRAGLSRQMVEKYAGGSEPSRENLIALARAGGVSLEWLAAGAGPMERGETGGCTANKVAEEPPGDGYIALPRYDVRASAGVGVPVLSEEVVDWIYFKAEWLRRTLGLSPSQLALIEAVGDSMSPGIEDGDLLLVDVGQPVLKGDGVYVLAMDDTMIGLMVKRVEITPHGGLVISSDNQRAGYGRYEIARSELASVRVVGRVVWVGGRI
jgi:phage repressor protein C with HTH and peptisase S24 domain